MMSIERELLQAIILKVDGLEGIGLMPIIKECKELLAQPEPFKPDWVNYRQGVEDGINQAKNAQPKQEPVGIVKTIGGYPDNSAHTVELTCRHGDLRDGDLLYKAPQKREPLSDDEVIARYKAISIENALYVPTYYAGFRDEEKAHGIGGGE